jgi:hypothetical protein
VTVTVTVVIVDMRWLQWCSGDSGDSRDSGDNGDSASGQCDSRLLQWQSVIVATDDSK